VNPDPELIFQFDADPNPYPTTPLLPDWTLQCSKMALRDFHLFTLMRIQIWILLFPLMRIRIQHPKMMRIHANPQHWFHHQIDEKLQNLVSAAFQIKGLKLQIPLQKVANFCGT
jgi:hypothetical protein